MADAIKKTSRWILFFTSLVILLPSPQSDPKKQIEFGSILVLILAGMLALDMLYLILKFPRKRPYILIEFGLYTVFIGLFIFRLITSKAISSLMSPELNAVGGRPLLLIIFFTICIVLIASVMIVMIDAKNAWSRSGKTGTSPMQLT